MFEFNFEHLEADDNAQSLGAESSIAERQACVEGSGKGKLPGLEASSVEVPGEEGGVSEQGLGAAAEEQLVGHWAYVGRRGRTVYSVRRAGSGHLLFRGPDAEGAVLSGVLLQQGHQVQATLVNERGREVGVLRLTLSGCGDVIVSSFRRLESEDWGRDIVAHRVAPGAGAQEPAQRLDWEGAFTVHTGFLRAGGDILVAEMTLAEAKAKCQSLGQCRGFCFRGEQRAEVAQKVYFKDKWELTQQPPCPGGWTSYRLEDVATRLSDLPGACLDQELITEVCASRFESVYVFKSPLATFPEWKKKLKVHQIIILWHPDGVGLQLEYFVGGVHFQRKPHPWVHRRGAELVAQVTPQPQPLDGFSGEEIAQVLRKWQGITSRDAEEGGVSKDCILFAMEVVEATGAMSSRLFGHFQHALGQQFAGM